MYHSKSENKLFFNYFRLILYKVWLVNVYRTVMIPSRFYFKSKRKSEFAFTFPVPRILVTYLRGWSYNYFLITLLVIDFRQVNFPDYVICTMFIVVSLECFIRTLNIVSMMLNRIKSIWLNSLMAPFLDFLHICA